MACSHTVTKLDTRQILCTSGHKVYFSIQRAFQRDTDVRMAEGDGAGRKYIRARRPTRRGYCLAVRGGG